MIVFLLQIHQLPHELRKYRFMTDQNLVSFQISSDGKAINQTFQVVEIEVHNNVSGVSQARIVVLASDISEVTDAAEFKVDRKIGIKLGYDGKDKSVFNGVVTGQSLHIKSGQGVAYEVICESFDEVEVIPPDDISNENSTLKLSYGADILSCSMHADPNVSSQIMGGIGIEGNSQVVPGSIVSLKGLGEIFNGNQYVSGVNHHVANGNWYTDVNIGLAKEGNQDFELDETLYN